MSQTRDDVVYAGFLVRLVASLIDTLIIAVPLGVVIYFLSDGQWFDFTAYMENLRYAMHGNATRALSQMPQTQMTWEVIFEISVMAVVILFWRRWKGATPGKRYLGIRIVDAESFETIDNKQAIIRTIGYIASTMILLMGFVMVAFRSDKRGLHDLMAGTAVIYEMNEEDGNNASSQGE